MYRRAPAVIGLSKHVRYVHYVGATPVDLRPAFSGSVPNEFTHHGRGRHRRETCDFAGRRKSSGRLT